MPKINHTDKSNRVWQYCGDTSVWFTKYNGVTLAVKPWFCVDCFHWHTLEDGIRIDGYHLNCFDAMDAAGRIL